MDKNKGTEIIERRLHELLKEIHEEYNGELQFRCESSYSDGRITIKVK